MSFDLIFSSFVTANRGLFFLPKTWATRRATRQHLEVEVRQTNACALALKGIFSSSSRKYPWKYLEMDHMGFILGSLSQEFEHPSDLGEIDAVMLRGIAALGRGGMCVLSHRFHRAATGDNVRSLAVVIGDVACWGWSLGIAVVGDKFKLDLEKYMNEFMGWWTDENFGGTGGHVSLWLLDWKFVIMSAVSDMIFPSTNSQGCKRSLLQLCFGRSWTRCVATVMMKRPSDCANESSKNVSKRSTMAACHVRDSRTSSISLRCLKITE